MNQTIVVSDTQSKTLYKVAAIMALLIATAGIVDAVTSNMGAEARGNNTVNIVEWFALFQTNPFSAFSTLGVINIITLSMGIPIYLAFHIAHRQDHPALTAFASILFFIGTAVYIASNTVFSLFALSQQYATATEVQKPLLEAAGSALLAQGADLTSGTVVGLLLTQIAGIVIASVMLRGRLFGKWIGGTGLAGFSLMTIFFILAAFAPEHFGTAMAVAMPGGLALTAYQVMLARRFFQIGR